VAPHHSTEPLPARFGKLFNAVRSLRMAATLLAMLLPTVTTRAFATRDRGVLQITANDAAVSRMLLLASVLPALLQLFSEPHEEGKPCRLAAEQPCEQGCALTSRRARLFCSRQVSLSRALSFPLPLLSP
jgi:hypothetical protein